MEKDYIGLQKLIAKAEACYFATLFPGYFGNRLRSAIRQRRSDIDAGRLRCYLGKLLRFVMDDKRSIARTADELVGKLADIKEIIMTDVKAAYDGDPAATSFDEIILSYPAFKAIGIYRFAHELYLKKIPIIPRMMTEYMHGQTGIDIHPGAVIGSSFFIDHGTGVVIGETATIGEHVKLYQNVTLGAKSFDVGEDGTLVKGIKRHPDIGDHVVVYAGATILGGETVIGDNAVIGGGTWITHSVPAGKTVTISNQVSTSYKVPTSEQD